MNREEATKAIGVGYQVILNYFSPMDRDQNEEVTWEERMIFLSKPESKEPSPAPPAVPPEPVRAPEPATTEIKPSPKTKAD